jgi:thioredoxin-dependent peroxiredoxin
MHAYRDQYASLFRSGQDIVLIAISTDTPQALYEWARDDQFQFLFASDEGSKAGQLYGAFISRDSGPVDNRSLFVVNPEGRIAYVAAPFREIDPVAYEELGDALQEIAPPPEQ